MKTILICFGTRPEAIKMAPVVQELLQRGQFRVVTCLTGQHREMLDQVIELFALPVDHNLRIMKRTQSLTQITAAALEGLKPILRAESPDMVIVHGDTTTTFAAALAAFYQQIPVAHVEAGLRTTNLYNPYPEEGNRRLADRLTEAHYAPTPAARDALLAEGLGPDSILVTGNTVIDALLKTLEDGPPEWPREMDRAWERPGTKILVTVHRRESWGAPMESIARAIGRVCGDHPDSTFIFPIHLNPVVRETFHTALEDESGVVFTEPLPYREFVHLMNRVDLVITDSGGIQEEAPTLGKPVLVMRETTERPEGVEAGTARLVGTKAEDIAGALGKLITDDAAYRRMAQAVNPYGDGHAAERIADDLERRLNLTDHPPHPFDPS